MVYIHRTTPTILVFYPDTLARLNREQNVVRMEPKRLPEYHQFDELPDSKGKPKGVGETGCDGLVGTLHRLVSNTRVGQWLPINRVSTKIRHGIRDVNGGMEVGVRTRRHNTMAGEGCNLRTAVPSWRQAPSPNSIEEYHPELMLEARGRRGRGQ